MNQSTKIAGTLALAFLVFITAKGELPDYLACLGLGPRAKAIPKDHPADAASSDSGGGFDAGDAAKLALEAAKLAAMFG